MNDKSNGSRGIGRFERRLAEAVGPRHGRREPYTEIGVRRLPCVRCGQPATQQWQICADGNLYRPICADCDVEMNDLVLLFVGDPDRERKVQEYATSLGVTFSV